MSHTQPNQVLLPAKKTMKHSRQQYSGTQTFQRQTRCDSQQAQRSASTDHAEGLQEN